MPAGTEETDEERQELLNTADTLEDIREGNRYKKHDPARILRMNPRIDNEFKRILRDIKRILSDQDERY